MTKNHVDINAPYSILNFLGKSIVYELLGQISEQSWEHQSPQPRKYRRARKNKESIQSHYKSKPASAA